MGTTPNVGLMAQKAEEYGSHDKTFQIATAGTVRIVDEDGDDVARARGRSQAISGAPVRPSMPRSSIGSSSRSVGPRRPATRPCSGSIRPARTTHRCWSRCAPNSSGSIPTASTLEVLPVAEATRFTLARARAGEDTISVTGNVLRDYLTDLFPILELGTSAKMLSIVPLMNGGGLFETGAGGSAPKHVQQFERENHLRWDSLGEFLALAVSLEMLADRTDNPRARLLGETLDRATGSVLEQRRSPSRRVHELDNRGSHFYLALYWATALAEQSQDAELAQRFATLAQRLAEAEQTIVAELDEVQGSPVEVGGYYHPDPARVTAALRPSATFNALLEGL